MTKTNNKILNEWTIKADESNKELFGDVEKLEIIKQKIILGQKKYDKLNSSFLKCDQNTNLTNMVDVMDLTEKFLELSNELRFLGNKIFVILNLNHQIASREGSYLSFLYNMSKNELIVTECLEEEDDKGRILGSFSL
jgi:hypothetical protein